MSYRIYLNNVQILGNGECPVELIEELKRRGCKMDEDYCFKDFEIKDLNSIIYALEDYLRNKYNKVGKALCDFSYCIEEDSVTPYIKYTYTYDGKDLDSYYTIYVPTNTIKVEYNG